MADPAIVQGDIVASAAAVTSQGLAWPGATTLGNRLLLFVGINDNTHTVTPTVPAGWTLLGTPGKVTRQASGTDAISVLVYEKLNAASESGTKTVTFDVASYVVIALVEVANSSTTQDSDGANGGVGTTGSAQTLNLGPTVVTTRSPDLVLGFVCSGNKDAHSNPQGGFAVYKQAGSGTPSSTAKLYGSILQQIGATLTAYSGSVDVAGGFNHSYAAITVAIPPPSGAVVTPGVLPNTDDGKGHFACSVHYYSGAPPFDTLAHAQALADKCDILTGQTTKFDPYADDIVARNTDVLIALYEKSAVSTEAVGHFRDSWYAKTQAGATIQLGNGFHVMQPDSTGSATVDGVTATGWDDFKSKDTWLDVDNWNTAVGSTVCTGVYLDSMGSSSYTATAWNSTAGRLYSAKEWIALVRSIGDAVLNARPGSWVLANGLTNAYNYEHAGTPTKGLLDHCHIGLSENWIHNNYALWANAFPADVAHYEPAIDSIIDANVNKGKGYWCIINIANSTAASPPSGWTDYTAAQVTQLRRFAYCTYMLGNRGKAWFEFIEKTTIKPWNETDTYYGINLGAPLESPSSAAAMLVTGVYRRRYTNGVILTSLAGGTRVADRDYTDPVTGTVYLTGATITLPANTGLILQTGSAPVGNTAAPAVAIIGPASILTPPASAILQFTATDADGIASVSAVLDGGAAVAPVLLSGIYTYDFGGLTPGQHSIAVSVTDAHATPRTTTATKTFTVSDPSLPTPDSIAVSNDVSDVQNRIRQRGLVP